MSTQNSKQYLFAGLTKELYQAHIGNLHQSNLQLTKILTVVSGVLALVLAISSEVIDTILPARTLYFALAVAMVAVGLLAHGKFAKDTEQGTVLLYLFVYFVYIFGLLLGAVVQAKGNTVMFCVLLVTLPMLVADYFWRAVLPGIVMEIVFLMLAVRFEPTAVFNIDLTNSLSCLVLGIVLAYQRTKNRAREFALRDTLRGQRDTDALTKLTNRGAAEDMIRQILADGSIPCAMVLIDVDNFKAINDSFGHDTGDKVLSGIALCIRSVFRASDLVCRLGGDEFMVFARNLSDEAIARQCAAAVLDAVASDSYLQSHNMPVTVSMGVVLSPQNGTDYNELYRKADAAMYNAKRAGKNSYAVFDARECAGMAVE